MKTDAVIVGAELDALVAACRLREHGHRVRLFAPGVGSLHYAPGGIHLLGYHPEGNGEAVAWPMDCLATLDHRHPYRLIGIERVRRALDWFFETTAGMNRKFVPNGGNTMALTPAGLGLPVYGPAEHQAGLENIRDRKLAAVQFRGYRDSPTGLVAAELRRQGASVFVAELDRPGGQTETVGLARAFDLMADPRAYFEALSARLPTGVETVLFPAVLGLANHGRIVECAAAAGLRCFEVATLPPSVPGLRLYQAFEKELLRRNAAIHQGARVTGTRAADNRCGSVTDDRGRSFDADVFIVATGGVLMGGLEVESHGSVRETCFGLEVFQTAPLEAETVDLSLGRLHETGVETDDCLRPRRNGSGAHENVFVTGSTLGHWNPPLEASSEGVSVVTGWAAAEAAHAYLEG